MDTKEVNIILRKKARTELTILRKQLLAQSPQIVLDRAYEYATKSDMVSLINETEFTAKQARALLRRPRLLDSLFKHRGKQQTGSGIGNSSHQFVHAADSRIDLLLIIRIVITGFITTDGKTVLAQTADLSAQISSINTKKPLQFTTVDGFAFSGMVFFEIFADCGSFIHRRFLLIFRDPVYGVSEPDTVPNILEA